MFDDIDRFVETDTPLGISGAFTGPARDMADHSKFSASVIANQSGSLHFEECDTPDGTWRRYAANNVVVNTSGQWTITPVRRYIRVYYANGATAQAVLEIRSARHD